MHQKDTTARLCAFCGVVITKRFTPSVLKRGWGLFCSNECCGKANRRRNSWACARCGMHFEAKASRRRTFCSVECAQNESRNGSRYAQPGWTKEGFLARIKVVEECWVWQAKRDRKGYGVLKYGSRIPVGAHRFGYQLLVGPIPDGLWVLHHCDNPPCVRPDHLFLGTQGDNMQDMAAKGRGRNQQGPFSQKVAAALR